MTIIHLWIALSAFGLLLSLYLSRESWLDLRVLSGNGTVRRELVTAWSRLIREFLRATVHAVYLGIGLPLHDREVGLTFVVAGLMWGNVVLVLNSLIDARTRRLLVAIRDAEPPPH